MISVLKYLFRQLVFDRYCINRSCCGHHSYISFRCSKAFIDYVPMNPDSSSEFSITVPYSHLNRSRFRTTNLLSQTRTMTKVSLNTSQPSKPYIISFYSSSSNNNPPRSFRKKTYKKSKSIKPALNVTEFELLVSQLPPRFTPDDLCRILTVQEEPYVCHELFNWASQQLRFRHDTSTYHITIKKLGSAKLYEEMDDVVNQALAVPDNGSEALYNTIIYFFTEARKLARAIYIYKHMRKSKDPSCRPSIKTFNLLFTAFLSRGSNSYINHMYMETIRCLFRQMVNDGIEPDIFSLNSMIKGYVLSLHINDALRIFHQMDVVYNCPPNSHSFNYLIHGLCVQGRTNNARQLYGEMKNKGFVPSSKAYNSLVNALAIGGEVKEAVNFLWEMAEEQRSTDFITYRTVLEEICRHESMAEAIRLLKQLQEKDLISGQTYRKLLCELEDNFGDSNDKNEFR